MFLQQSEDDEPESDGVKAESEVQQSSSGTRDFPHYDVKKEAILVKFVQFLTSMDRPESSAISISRDVSKYLKYASGDGPPPQWSQLTNREILNAYQRRTQWGTAQVRCHSRCSQISILDDDDRAQEYHKATKSWKTKYRKRLNKANALLVEKQSETRISFDEATSCVRSEEVVKKAKVGCADSKHFDSATYFLAHAVMAVPGAHTGAVVNLRLAEWEDSRSVKGMTVITVHDHKTGLLGTAKSPLSSETGWRNMLRILGHKSIEGRRLGKVKQTLLQSTICDSAYEKGPLTRGRSKSI